MIANRFLKGLGAGLVVLTLLCTLSVSAAAAADTLKPTKPAGLAATNVGASIVTLSWTKSTDDVGVKSYAIFSNKAYLTYTTETSITLNNLSPATTYTFYVAAQDAAGNISGASNKVTVTTKANAPSGQSDTVKPSTPTGLAATSVGTNSVALSWQQSTDDVGVKSYAVFSNQAYLTYTANTEITLNNLIPGSTYTFYVAAQDAAGNISGASNKVTVTTQTDAAAGKIIAGYYASWAAYSGYTPSDIPVSKLTHILYAFANIGSDNKIALGDSQVDLKNFAELRELKKKYPSLRTLISVGGWEWSGRFSNVAATAGRREAFADSVAGFLVNYGFDGVDIDWEYPVSGGKSGNAYRASDKENFTLLLKALREKLDAQGAKDGKRYLLTMAGGASKDYVSNVQMKSIARYLDFSVLMAYDIHGFSDKYTDHNAPLYGSTAGSPQFVWSADQAVQAWVAAGYPKSKLLMGVPFYGHRYSNVQGGGTGILKPYSGYKTVEYDDIVSKYLSDKSYTRYYGAAGRTPWLFNGTTFITYEDAASLTEKAGYINTQGLAGAAIWELSQNTNGTLLNALYQNLK